MADGLGVIWECDNCHAIEEIGNYDDEPVGWLVDEPNEDDYPRDEEVPWDLILCKKCRIPKDARVVTPSGAEAGR